MIQRACLYTFAHQLAWLLACLLCPLVAPFCLPFGSLLGPWSPRFKLLRGRFETGGFVLRWFPFWGPFWFPSCFLCPLLAPFWLPFGLLLGPWPPRFKLLRGRFETGGFVPPRFPFVGPSWLPSCFLCPLVAHFWLPFLFPFGVVVHPYQTSPRKV